MRNKQPAPILPILLFVIGVITGCYSSIFVAAPVLIDFARNKPLGDQDKTVSREPIKKKPVLAK